MEEDAQLKKEIEADCHFVIDGAALIHIVHWTKGDRFIEIVDQIFEEALRYPSESGFDGYNDESIKSQENKRRYTVSQSCDVNIKQRFLSNTTNKAELIEFLSTGFGKTI